MNLKLPPIFIAIPTSTQTTVKIRPKNIVAMEDSWYYNDRTTIVTHTEGSFMTALTSQEIEDGMDALQEQYDTYYDQINNLGDDQ